MNDIKEFDDVFDDDDRLKIVKKIDKSSWKFGHSATPESKSRFWFIQLRDDSFFATNLFEKIQFKIGAQCILRRVFANGQTYGLDGCWHTDSTDSDQYTFVYYVNEDWKSDWGGETLFNINNKIITIIPKHNKGIFFPSNVIHYGKSPSRECYKLRITLAFHFKVINWLK